MSKRSAPGKNDKGGVKRTKMRSAQKGDTPWNLATLWGFFGTITRRQYDTVHAAECPCCIEIARQLQGKVEQL